MKNQEARELLRKYNENICTQEELSLLHTWYIRYQAKTTEDLSFEDWMFLMDVQPQPQAIKKIGVSWKRIAVAASLVFLITTGVLLYYSKHEVLPSNESHIIKPGGNKAILTLSDGQQISLEDAGQGELVQKSGVRVIKTADGEIVYTAPDISAEKHQENTVSTPRGGQWQIRLSDGSRVFLNAESSLSFPGSFSGKQKRTVRLKGEAYFEIAKDIRHPFIVTTEKQSIEVLGTHFNVSSYLDDGYIRTTLLEGSVKIHADNAAVADVLLKPGMEAFYNGNTLQLSNVDTDEAVAWKNGQFSFEDQDIYSIMRKIGRWYDIEVEYDNKLNTATFGGKISVNRPLIKTLNLLKSTGKVDFQIKGRRVIVL
ncbi:MULTISPECIES: FecR family protein [unclassified Sphingobacterium]|uniref:FecR family protein n=1 Tax=unclassified Sphingobacterium TaxID=2609468 RepID=UPI0025ED43A6|nr:MULTISPECIES: FecR family protein [unclassified Sphingobacterium]